MYKLCKKKKNKSELKCRYIEDEEDFNELDMHFVDKHISRDRV